MKLTKCFPPRREKQLYQSCSGGPFAPLALSCLSQLPTPSILPIALLQQWQSNSTNPSFSTFAPTTLTMCSKYCTLDWRWPAVKSRLMKRWCLSSPRRSAVAVVIFEKLSRCSGRQLSPLKPQATLRVSPSRAQTRWLSTPWELDWSRFSTASLSMCALLPARVWLLRLHRMKRWLCETSTLHISNSAVVLCLSQAVKLAFLSISLLWKILVLCCLRSRAP
mmetsp:Transcript_1560/g.3161  ORF Transcript_1560/g.3161 Transcript_1560/m.3161 type:complete len:221 (+) Transcript_1560:428-1090(+)